MPWLTLVPWLKKTWSLASASELLLWLHKWLVLLLLVMEALDLFSPLLDLLIPLSRRQKIASSFVLADKVLVFCPLTGLLTGLQVLQEKMRLLFRLAWTLKLIIRHSFFSWQTSFLSKLPDRPTAGLPVS